MNVDTNTTWILWNVKYYIIYKLEKLKFSPKMKGDLVMACYIHHLKQGQQNREAKGAIAPQY